jgi:hypothetical protein
VLTYTLNEASCSNINVSPLAQLLKKGVTDILLGFSSHVSAHLCLGGRHPGYEVIWKPQLPTITSATLLLLLLPPAVASKQCPCNWNGVRLSMTSERL